MRTYQRTKSSYYLLLLLLLTLTGCQTTKQAVGEYVAEALQTHTLARLDTQLATYNTSIAEIKSALDTNNNQVHGAQELVLASKQTIQDAALMELHKAVVAGGKGSQSELLNYLLGLVAAYLAKQVYSAKSDGKRDARIQVLEKLLHRDIDGDGVVGKGSEK